MSAELKVTITQSGYTWTYDQTQIIINPVISKMICSGGYSVGNTACGCLKVGVPSNIYSKGAVVKIFYSTFQIIGDFYLDSFEKCGKAKLKTTDTDDTQMVMLTCYDGMSKLDDYVTFSDSEVTDADICDAIETATGIYFKSGDKTSGAISVTKEVAESKTMREWLGIIGCYIGCNWSVISKDIDNVLVANITQIPIDYSGDNLTTSNYTRIDTEQPIQFSRVISRASGETFSSGNTDSYTLSINCEYATDDSNDIIKTNISGKSYQAFSCDKCLINYVSLDIGDKITFGTDTTAYSIYNLNLVISIAGLYLTCSADVQKKKLDEEVKPVSKALECVTDFAISVSDGVATLTWKNPSNCTGVIIRRKQATDFINIFEGDAVYTGTGETYADTLPNTYTTYYYRIISYKDDDYNADCDTVNALATTDPPPDKYWLFRYSSNPYIYDECEKYTYGWEKYSTNYNPMTWRWAFNVQAYGLSLLAYSTSSAAETYIQIFRGFNWGYTKAVIEFYISSARPTTLGTIYFSLYKRQLNNKNSALTLITQKTNETDPSLFTDAGTKQIELPRGEISGTDELILRIGCTSVGARGSIDFVISNVWLTD